MIFCGHVRTGAPPATVAPQSDGPTTNQGPTLKGQFGEPGLIVRHANRYSARRLALLVFAPLIAGCSGASDLMSLKDAEWFARPGRLFIKNVSIDAPPLTPDKPVTAEDLASADGACPGMAPPGSLANANASTDGPAGAPPPSLGAVALGHTECDVVRGIGAPDSVNISNSPRSERVAVITWSRGPRAGIYTFTGGRLSSVERGPEPVAVPDAPKAKKKKPAPT
jgi:hypothetical protein